MTSLVDEGAGDLLNVIPESSPVVSGWVFFGHAIYLGVQAMVNERVAYV